jgi:hypothetical protein
MGNFVVISTHTGRGVETAAEVRAIVIWSPLSSATKLVCLASAGGRQLSIPLGGGQGDARPLLGEESERA